MFKSVSQFVDSYDDGKYNISTFRKALSSVATVANNFVDYTYFSGNPIANFYASTPLEAALIESNKGIFVPPVENQFIKSLCVMSAAASSASPSNQRQRLHLMDYLLYYPFIDTDAVGEIQSLVNNVSLPRYATGDGVRIIAVGQSASSAVGQFTINYTNSNGVSGRVSQNTFTKIIGGGGILVSSTNNAVSGSQMVIELQAGDSGVRSIESVTFTAGGGGLMALVLVYPLWESLITEECRGTATESFGAAFLTEAIIDRPTKKIENGAVLGIVGLGNAGSLASSVLIGNLETVWS